nr:MAG TPA: hypothetical protein [Caudoviricetes sp.]
MGRHPQQRGCRSTAGTPGRRSMARAVAPTATRRLDA